MTDPNKNGRKKCCAHPGRPCKGGKKGGITTLTSFKSLGGSTSLSHSKQQHLIRLHLLFKAQVNIPPTKPTNPPNNANINPSLTGKTI